MSILLKRIAFLTLFVGVIVLPIPGTSHAVVDEGLINVVGNAGFEDDIGTNRLGDNFQDGRLFRGNWDNTPNRGLSRISLGALAPEGAMVLQLSEPALAVGTAGAFTFQTFKSSNVVPGAFASFTAAVRLTATDGTDIQLQIEFNDSRGRQLLAVNTGASGLGVSTLFSRLTVNATAPEETVEVVYTIRLQGGVAVGGATIAQVDDVVGTISKFPIALDFSASKPQVTRGSAAFITTRVKNVSALTLANLELVTTLPEGFTLIDGSSSVDGLRTNSRPGSRIFNLGTIQFGESNNVGFLLAASSAVRVGKKYEIEFLVRQTNGIPRSALRQFILTVVADPLFEEGIILGKVFDDRNKSRTQDDNENGIPGVKIATEEGIMVVTDAHGRYNIPAIKPGRHVVKIDGHSLPKGSKFVTEEARLVKSTEGMLNVVNFAVKLPEPQIPKQYRDQLNVLVSQGVDMSRPELTIDLQPDILWMGEGYFEVDPVFKIRTNYADFISSWRIEITDIFGDTVWSGYGLGTPPIEAPWNGRTKARKPIESGTYAYRLIVRDADGREDWTPLKYFRVINKKDKSIPNEPTIQIPAVGNMSIDRDGKRSIPVAAKPRLLVRGSTVPWNSITVNGEAVNVSVDGSFSKELFVQPGQQSVVVTTTDPEGNSLSYQEEAELKDSYFFMVGLGEQELGINNISGNAEVVGREETFEQGFYEDGRLAFYLKGKLKGKFLVTARYDTDDPRHDLFTNLDPDEYYPVYGDDSEIEYDAYDSKERFYILIEMDRSFAKWGSFHTNFTDTELSSHNRTFSGAKVYYETLASTQYGDPSRGFVVYSADVDQLADHNEFLGTLGSLFYLRNQNVIEGSEKIRVEVRDKISGIATHSYDLFSGQDYEMDYSAGRVILSEPLSARTYSETIISDDIINGNTYLIVDYEFDAQGSVSNRNNGVRGWMHMGDHIRVGGTAIEDKRPTGDYDLRGLDLVGKFGENTKVVVEYARTKDLTARNSVSFDGGITWNDITTGNSRVEKANRLFDDAYLIKAETKLKTNTDITGYVQDIQPGFANADLIRQAGARKAGLEVRQHVGEFVEMSYRYDHQKSKDPDNNAGLFVESPEESSVHTAQIKADYEDYLVIAEYRHQTPDAFPDDIRTFNTALDDKQFENAFAVKAGYRTTEDAMPYAKIQLTKGGDTNHQFGGGIEAKVLEGKGMLRLEHLIGNIGDSTELSFDVQTSETTNVYTALRTGPDDEGHDRVLTSTIGSSTQINARSRVYSEREFSSYRGAGREASVLGYDAELSDRWGVNFDFERSHLWDVDEVNSHRNAAALEIRYLDSDILKIISRYEMRFDTGSRNRIHWLFRDTVDWKINEDYRANLRFNRSDTNRFISDSFRTDASFTELNVGLAYRPVKNNRLNFLTKYTWLFDEGTESQFDTPDIFGIEADESSHIFAVEFDYQLLPPHLDIAQKLAYRRSTIHAEGDSFNVGNLLWLHRFNYHMTRKWDIILEYRMLWNMELLDSLDQGVLVEVDREFFDYVRLGVGYNFTHFDDDLRVLNDVSRHGFYTRVSGKF